MPIPAELEGKSLIGSIWIRRMGKHRGFKWQITKTSDTGVVLEPEKQNLRGWRTHIGDNRRQSITWPMFMNLYQPEGTLDMIVTVDKEGYVQNVQKEGIERVNGVVKAPEKEIVKTQECKGAWHIRRGAAAMRPLSEFSVIEKGPRTGQLAVTCDSCRRKQQASQSRADAAKRVKLTPEERPQPVMVLDAALPLVHEIPAPYVPSETLKRWRVTIIKETEVIVEAHDYLDAGVAAGNGEVVRIERLT